MTAIISEDAAKERIAKRIARLFLDEKRRMFINLGVGIPTLVSNYIGDGEIFIQAENGILGVGPLAQGEQVDRQLINAGRQPVTETPGCCYFDSAMSFGMIRGGHVDATVIGSFEVDEAGNIANYIIPNGKQMGVGGAMDLVTGARRVIVGMQHLTRDGKAKIIPKCTLPVTGYGECDMIVTEYAVFTFEGGKLTLLEIAPEVNLDTIRTWTTASFEVSPNLKTLEV